MTDPTVQRIIDILKDCEKIQDRKDAAFVQGMEAIYEGLDRIAGNMKQKGEV